MKAAIKVSLALLLLLSICRNSYAGDFPTLRTFDYLCPEASILDDYRHDYYSVIGKTFHKYRGEEVVLGVLSIPSFEPEWFVGVKKADAKNVVFLVRAREQIWGYRDDWSKLPDDLLVEYATEIDPDIVQLLTDLWEAMLLNTRYPRRIYMGHDGTRYHFSLCLVNKQTRGYFSGQTWSPEENTKPGMLVKIGELLADYVQAKPDEREGILLSIRTKAYELQKRLKADGEMPDK